MEQVVAVGLVLVIFLGLLGLRLRALLRHRVPGDDDADLVRRWSLYEDRGNHENWPPGR